MSSSIDIDRALSFLESYIDDDNENFNGDDLASQLGKYPSQEIDWESMDLIRRTYDVFLSFRGEDTRASFTSHLFASLQNDGITVSRDDDSLPRGDHISTSLLRAIEESQISVIVFSRNYANSHWCLRELEKIMECHRTIGQVVLPVFYDVDPSEVRHQTGEFGKAFQDLINRTLREEDEGNWLSLKTPSESWTVESWRMALSEAGGIAGFVVLNSRNESEAIKDIGTDAVEGLALKLPRTDKQHLITKAFKNMKTLRLLQLAGVQLDGDFKYLSRNLRWLCWNGFPLTCIPANFCQGSLVSIELENSNVKLVWEKSQRLEKLKILNLSHSHHLTQTPDFSNLPNLEKLVLTDCRSLSEISHTIGHLNKVLLINLKGCVSLRSLPRSIYKLKSLKTLILSGCLMIDKLEEDLEQMESLTTLIADNTAITRVPFSLVRSKSIGYISLCGYEGFSRDVFPSIIWSWMSPTNNPLSLVQNTAGMSSVVSLDVSNSSSQELSSISKDLPKLRSLWVECGSELQLSRDAATILDALYATNSKELESTATASQASNIETSDLIECSSQVNISGPKNSLKSLLIQMGMNCQVTNILKESITQSMTISGCEVSLLPGDNYPDWLTFNCEDSSVIFEVPQVNGRNLKTLMCIVHYSTPDDIASDGLKNVLVINHTKSIIQLYKRDTLASFENEEWQRVVSNIEAGNKVQVVVVFENGFIVKKTTIYLIYDEPSDGKMEHCYAADKNEIVSSGDEIECAVRRISPQVESTDDFKQKQKRRKIE
ncbi:Toll/interleukin-1 receptor-like proteiny [Sesbania bispinosa]|nr:Toll/interleukin-1 receptor-like proteiny [Sesbania bispinosa]